MNKIEDLPTIQLENSACGKRLSNRQEISDWLLHNESSYYAARKQAAYMQLEEKDIDLYILLNYVYKSVGLENHILDIAKHAPITMMVPKKP